MVQALLLSTCLFVILKPPRVMHRSFSLMSRTSLFRGKPLSVVHQVQPGCNPLASHLLMASQKSLVFWLSGNTYDGCARLHVCQCQHYSGTCPWLQHC